MSNEKLDFKILHFANYSPDFPGAFIETIKRLTLTLNKNRINSMIVVPVYRSWHSELKEKGITVDVFPSPVIKKPFNFIKLLFAFRKLVARYNIKIIHCHFSRDYVLFSIIYKIFFDNNILIIWHIHSWPATITGANKNLLKSIFRKSFYKIISNWIIEYVVVSPELGKWFRKITQKVVYVPNGISLEKFDKINHESLLNFKNEFLIPENAKIICSIANFRPEKDHFTLLKAIKEVIQQEPNVFILLVGDGPTKKENETLATTLEIKKNVIFTGLRKDIENLIYLSDLFVLSTHGEGLPYVICEAMASRKAVIATNVRGCRDIVTSNTGILVEHLDYHKFAEDILCLLNNPQRSQGMGSNGRKIIESEFTIDKQVDNIINIYKNYL